jgi:hypothetical protein
VPNLTSEPGPYETEDQVCSTSAVRAVYDAYRAGIVSLRDGSADLLLSACEEAGVALGAYDKRILAWFAGFEPQTAAVVAGMPCAARDDIIAVVSELAANAICHTESGRGGQFSVEVMWSGPHVSVMVGDGGGASEPRIIEDADGEHGRGLRMVRALSVGVGVSGDERGRFVRADLAWAADAYPGTLDVAPNQVTTAELEILQSQFAGIPIWFGLMTRQWWAMIKVGGGDELISASSARELADGLTAMRAVPAMAGDHGYRSTRTSGGLFPQPALTGLSEGR